MMSGSARATGEAFCNGIVRRMVRLPRNLLGGFSRAVNQGMDLMGIGGRRNQNPPPTFPSANPPEPVVIQEEWAFLASFEQQYGTLHPFFYACRFTEALKMARDEHKFLFLYLHSPEHPFTPSFCREALCSELVTQFLDANFVCWGGLANRGQGLEMAVTLQPGSFPFCAVVAPAPGDYLAVLQQIEGPVSPAALVEILQRTMEEQGLAFGIARTEEEDKKRADQRLRKEQDAAYLAALQTDQEKERLKNLPSEKTSKKKQVKMEASNTVNDKNHKMNPMKMQTSKVREATAMGAASRGNGAQVTQILIRFPNGERREQGFLSSDTIGEIYKYIDSLGMAAVGNYRLVSNFPRKIYGGDQMKRTLKDAGLHPGATLFLELL